YGIPGVVKGDTDGDGDFDFDDIPGFVAILGGNGAQSVPEPSTAAMILIGAVCGLCGIRRRLC
ncbi:MAG: PEP-CTERM sorting domain-containing protein, partial [Pirellulales bacterium]